MNASSILQTDFLPCSLPKIEFNLVISYFKQKGLERETGFEPATFSLEG